MTGLIRQDSNILPSLEHLHICLYHGDMRAISSDRAQFILVISNDALRTTFRAIESRQVNPRYGKTCIVYSKSRQLYKWLPVTMMLTKKMCCEHPWLENLLLVGQSSVSLLWITFRFRCDAHLI